MDLQVYAIILIVFLVSFLSYLFISKFLPHGKTFDEMIAEKKRMREEVLGTLKPSSGKQSNTNTKKKPKKEIKKRDNQQKAAKEIVTSNESDASEETNHSDAPMPPTPPEVSRRNVVKPQQSQNTKKSKGKGGILVNRNEPVMIKEVESAEEVNHFVEIHPKDAIEIQRSAPKEEEKNTKNFRENRKPRAAKETPPVSPKNQPVKETTKPVEEKIVKKKKSEQQSAVDGNAAQLVTDETGITPLIRELSRADMTKNQIQVLIDFLLNKQSDTIARDPAEWSEGKSDLVQKLKKQLQEKEAQLKNEQDALSGMQLKLKELRNEFNTEKIQSNATLKAHMEQTQSSRAEIKNLQAEIQFLNDKHNNEKQSMSVSFKQLQTKYMQVSDSLKAQENLPNAQQLQNEIQLLQQEIVKKNQQIMELNVKADENRQKDEALKEKVNECDSKIAEYDVCLRKKDESCKFIENELRQRSQDITSRDNEIQKLNVEIARVKEIVQRQTIEVEKLNQQLDDQHNRADENNKIEVRNLQNALDSSKKEIEAQKVLVNDYKKKLDDLSKQLAESKQLTQKSGDSFLLNEKLNEMVANHQNIISEKDKQIVEYQKQVETLQKVESELSKQIDEQKAKNNDLRMKNWKLVEALQAAQSSSTIKSSNHSNFVNHPSIDVKKVKDLITQYFPDTTAASSTNDDDTKWLESVLENLKMQLVSNKSNHNSSTTSSNANHLNNNCSDVEKNNLNNNSTLNGDSTTNFTSSADNELIMLQNAQLKTTVEEYKNIIAETESMLKNLESKVREQDAYWTKVVLMKDNEIENLKSHAETS